MYRIATIALILAVYGDGHKYPADPEFAQSYAVRACECIGKIRNNWVLAENKAAVDLLYNTIQNIAWRVMTHPQMRLLCRFSGHLMYTDPLRPAADGELTLDWVAQMRKRTEEITGGSVDGLQSINKQDKPSGT
ncbi:hypothetical protein ONS95_005085 [Cadophora gregata]|uniref:uncharacterized protein n=1 Tax=Cadophora gregata TaxID=51156 RepID=UPI0026DAE58F|nr:uncharacterized protein ONS95_005085 [Cadophora gregata]KAK0104817.1 hypothetical protein ONS95_005085 [Cadophora gregata]KAK0115100.1 hypothetical protein ONS96_013570 [Cadophora gregata f. sp. sojae]